MCGETMQATTVAGVELDGCPGEDVVWFDVSELLSFRTGLAPAETAGFADESLPIFPKGMWIVIWPW
ncbi:MAG: zf-TFIIB domain-containing protein [Actinobacteria bacterium]|nr:zf-TFIIB domain-containing protein [Actinomycetota bacterium]